MSYTTPIDERALVADLQNPATAEEAFGLLMRTYGEKMYWQIRRMVLNHDDANDLLQNALIKAWTNIDHFRGDAKLSTWLYKIAVNEAINFINKEKNRASQFTRQDETDSKIENTLEADPWFDGDRATILLQKALTKLPEKQRLVFNMRYFDEMKYEEISEVLGTSVGALKASYHHAVKKIEQSLDGVEF